MPAYSLFAEPLASTTRRAVEIARDSGAIISVDLSSAAGIREYGGARLALDLAMLHPELVFASEADASVVATPDFDWHYHTEDTARLGHDIPVPALA